MPVCIFAFTLYNRKVYMCELTVEIKTCTHFRYVAFLIKFEVVASKASFSQISSFKRGNNFKFNKTKSYNK